MVTWVPTNREKAREPRGRAFWCWGCDGNHVWNGQRCSRCGKRDDGRRWKAGKSTFRGWDKE